MNKKILIIILLLILLLVSQVVFATSEYSPSRLAIFLSSPVVSTILLVVGVMLIVMELFLPTFGMLFIAGFSVIGLFFWSNIATGQAQWISLILFVVGIALLLIETTIPGFGVVGITGLILIVIGIIYGMGDVKQAVYSILLAIIISGVCVAFMVKMGLKSKFFNSIILNTTLSNENGYISSPIHHDLLNKKGKAVTDLKPSGYIEVDQKTYDALSEGELIKRGSDIEVVSIVGANVIVRRI